MSETARSSVNEAMSALCDEIASKRTSLACKLFGHKFSIRGLTGHYVWCKRCRQRRTTASAALK